MPTVTINFADLICLVIKPSLDFPAAAEVWGQYQGRQPNWHQLHDADPTRIHIWLIQDDDQLFERQPTLEIAPRDYQAPTYVSATTPSMLGQVAHPPGLTYDRTGKAVFTCVISATETDHRHTSEHADLALYYVTAYGEVAEIANALVPLGARVRIEGRITTHRQPIDSTIFPEQYAGAIDAERIRILDTVIVWRRR